MDGICLKIVYHIFDQSYQSPDLHMGFPVNPRNNADNPACGLFAGDLTKKIDTRMGNSGERKINFSRGESRLFSFVFERPGKRVPQDEKCDQKPDSADDRAWKMEHFRESVGI